VRDRQLFNTIIDTNKSKESILCNLKTQHMKRNVKSLIGYTMGATDGEIGKINELYFDDETWTIRYLIVETGNWLFGRKVLISPQALLTPNWKKEIFPVNLTKEQIKNSPDIDTEKPVSRQQEIELNKHYPWNSYWAGGFYGGMIIPISPELQKDTDTMAGKKSDDNPDLRSTAKVTGYKIKALDGEIGDVEDFIFDDSTWKVEFIVVDTGKWLPGKKVLISPKWITEIFWEDSSVIVKALVEQVKSSPEYDPSLPISDSYEENLQHHYPGFFL
jgi:uncharacterized protein YrrD